MKKNLLELWLELDFIHLNSFLQGHHFMNKLLLSAKLFENFLAHWSITHSFLFVAFNLLEIGWNEIWIFIINFSTLLYITIPINWFQYSVIEALYIFIILSMYKVNTDMNKLSQKLFQFGSWLAARFIKWCDFSKRIWNPSGM